MSTEKAYFDLNRTFTASQSGIARVLAPVTGNLVRAFVSSDTELDGGNALFDVNKNGATVFGDPDDRVKILDGDQSGDATGLAIAVTQYTDVITVDFDGFTGSAASVGGRLTLVLEFAESGGGGSSVAFARFTKNTAQNIGDAEAFPQALDWNVAGDDPEGFFNEDDFGDNGLAVVPGGMAGVYQIHAQVRWEGNSSGYRWLRISEDRYSGPTSDPDNFVETVTLADVRENNLGGTDPHYMHISATVRLEEFSVIAVGVWQNSGTDLDVQPGSGNDETWFTITRLG